MPFRKAAAPRNLHNDNQKRGDVQDAAVTLEGLLASVKQVFGEAERTEVDNGTIEAAEKASYAKSAKGDQDTFMNS